MDVVLEVLDTFVFDRIYANLLPVSPAVSTFDPISTIAASFKGYVNATSDASGSLADASFARSGWEYQPATEFFTLQPSEYAWMSRWDRDNVWRQLVTLYIITW